MSYSLAVTWSPGLGILSSIDVKCGCWNSPFPFFFPFLVGSHFYLPPGTTLFLKQVDTNRNNFLLNQAWQLVWHPKQESLFRAVGLNKLRKCVMLGNSGQALHSPAKDIRLNASSTDARAFNCRCDFTTTGKQRALAVRWMERLITGYHPVAIKVERDQWQKKMDSFKFFDIFLEMLSNIQQLGHPQKTLTQNLTKFCTLN